MDSSLPPLVPEVQAVDSQEMAFALSLFQGALRQQLPTRNPSQRGIDLSENPLASFVFEHMPAEIRDQFVMTGPRFRRLTIPLIAEFSLC